MTGESEPLLEGTLISHLLELRTRLMRAFLGVILVFIPFALYSNQLFEWLSHPLLQQLPANSMLISTSITAPFTAPLKLAFVAALVVAMPYVIFELWGFIAPGLYRR
jgi:sec-independent protein translocase protein TatC